MRLDPVYCLTSGNNFTHAMTVFALASRSSRAIVTIRSARVSRHLSLLAASVALLVVPAARSETYTQAASSFNHTCAIYGSGGLH